jgi:hypothetical protein
MELITDNATFAVELDREPQHISQDEKVGNTVGDDCADEDLWLAARASQIESRARATAAAAMGPERPRRVPS